MKYRYYTIILLILTFSFPHCSEGDVSKNNPSTEETRIIKFADYEWEVRTSREKAGPGPNYFSSSEKNVWVDSLGKLHLRITNDNGKWSCAGITLLSPTKYGEYIFETEVDLDSWDDNVVGGMFLYSSDESEIDIEYSRWGIDDNYNAQFVVQPGTKSDNKRRFDLDKQVSQQTSIINWSSDSISFFNYSAKINEINNGNLFYNWTYKGLDIPSEKEDLAVKINLWLFRGKTPQKKEKNELIISDFKIR